jgi:hypothetical protein
MKPHGFVRVGRMWCGMRTDPVLRCLNNLEGLSYKDMLVGIVPEVLS